MAIPHKKIRCRKYKLSSKQDKCIYVNLAKCKIPKYYLLLIIQHNQNVNYCDFFYKIVALPSTSGHTHTLQFSQFVSTYILWRRHMWQYIYAGLWRFFLFIFWFLLYDMQELKTTFSAYRVLSLKCCVNWWKQSLKQLCKHAENQSKIY